MHVALIGGVRTLLVFICVLVCGGCGGRSDEGTTSPSDEATLTRRELIGKRLFFDTSLSEPAGVACATCYDRERAFSGNNGSTARVPFGSRAGILGLRNTPSVMYAAFAPAFAMVDGDDGPTPTGGQFLDGREDLLAGQARRPFLSELEMNNPDVPSVVSKVAGSSYAALFQEEWGPAIFEQADAAFDGIAQSIAAFEATDRFHPFNSKYDRYVRGEVVLSAQEARGLRLFMDKDKGNCVACHAANPTSQDPRDSLFTDFTYDNLGVPRNAAIPANADPTFHDLGLCGPKRAPPLSEPTLCGAFKVPTLRNAARKDALMHNGFFKTLRDVVAFYATRDTNPSRWYAGGVRFDDLPPQYRDDVNTSEVPYNRSAGEVPALSDQEMDDLVAFLHTLTDD